MTPHGSLRLDQADDDFLLESGLADRLEKSFERGSAHGLLHLGTSEAGSVLPASLAWWRDFGMRFIADLCALGDAKGPAGRPELAAPTSSELAALIDDAPPMRGGEYLRPDVLAQHWGEIGQALEAELTESGLSLNEFLKARDSRWRFVGRVHFNLAENRRDPECPFAFMATYTSGVAASGALRHLPLGQALREFAGVGDKAKLLQLLDPVSRASEACSWLKAIVDAGEIFHPLRWTPQEALRFLHDVDAMEQAGLVICMPANWRMNRPSRPRVEGTVGSTSPSVLGLDALLDFQVGVSLDGDALTDKEIKELLASTDGLALVRGKWVEVNRERLQATLDKFQEIERLSRREGVPFGQAMRLLAGAEIDGGAVAEPTAQWAHVQAGPWLAEALEGCRSPEGLAKVNPGEALQATLRPYQETGLRWLHLLTQLGLGACLADDMGLGKTIQVLALLQTFNEQAKGSAEKDAKPPGRARFASGQLGARSRALHAASESRDRASLVPSRGRIGRHERRAPGGDRSGGDELWDAAAPKLDRPNVLASRGSRRGPSDQEPQRQTDQGRQILEGQGAHRPHRHPDRKQSARPVVDLRFRESGFARLREGLRSIRQDPRLAAPYFLRPAAAAGAALYPAQT